MDDDLRAWSSVVKDALTRSMKRSHSAVPGAKLRQAVARAAADVGLAYPPLGQPSVTFSEFLHHFPDLVAVLKRPGQDILVAPASSPELLVEHPAATDSSLPGIRRDMFTAFTIVPDAAKAWYNAEQDRIEWRTEPPSSNGWIEVPSPTAEQALADRREFAQTLDEASKERLLSALDGPKALADFAGEVRTNGLQPQWHQFRVKLVTERIAQWSQAAGIAWRDAWITTSTSGKSAPAQTASDESEPMREWRGALTTLVQVLTQEDLARISIPLDIVARALQKRR